MFSLNILTLILFKVAVQTSKFCMRHSSEEWTMVPIFSSEYLAPIQRQTPNKPVYYVVVVVIFIVSFVY